MSQNSAPGCSPTLYEVLGVSSDATRPEIVAAARSLVQELQSDRLASCDTEHRLQMIRDAQEILSNPTRRRNYDRILSSAARPAPEIGEAGPGREVMRRDGSGTGLTLRQHLRLGGALLRRCWLEDIVFEGVDFSRSDLSGAAFDRCDFINCVFRKTVLKHASFTSCVFCDSAVIDPVVGHTDFSHSKFVRCNLRILDWSRCRKHGVQRWDSNSGDICRTPARYKGHPGSSAADSVQRLRDTAWAVGVLMTLLVGLVLVVELVSRVDV